MSNWSEGVEGWIKQGQQMMAERAAHIRRMKRCRFDTLAVHGLYGQQSALQNQGSILEPAYLSPSQHFADSDQMEAALAYQLPAWVYSRIHNPTVGWLEDTLALMETYGSDMEAACCATASGMAAIFMATNPLLTHPETGMNIVASAQCYGGTFMLFSERYARERGVEIRWVENPLDLQQWADAMDDKTRFVYGEMPSNPGLAVFDIAGVAALAHEREIPLIVDSTIATPALMRPLLLGADIVVHSVSKIMAASGMAIAGAVVSRPEVVSRHLEENLRENYALQMKLLPFRDHGPGLSPFNALMVLNDLRALRSRVDQMSQSALAIARFLNDHPAVEAVGYPGLENHPSHDLAKTQMRLVDVGQDDERYGYLLSFNVRGGARAARRVMDRLQMIYRATDLGRVKTVATIPAISTHQQQGEEGRALAGIPANQIRLSAGMEDVRDIIADLEQALEVA